MLSRLFVWSSYKLVHIELHIHATPSIYFDTSMAQSQDILKTCQSTNTEGWKNCHIGHRINLSSQTDEKHNGLPSRHTSRTGACTSDRLRDTCPRATLRRTTVQP